MLPMARTQTAIFQRRGTCGVELLNWDGTPDFLSGCRMCCQLAGDAKPRQLELPRRASVCCQGRARDRCHDGSADGDAEGQSKRSSVTMLEESMILMSLAAACRMER